VWEIEKKNWKEFDRDVFDNPGTIGSCVFLPARKMYESCGFKETVGEPWERDPEQNRIHYQKLIG
jgi:hypothetical protein